MRILFVLHYFPSLSETFVLNQITGLIDRDLSIDIIADFKGSNDQISPETIKYNLFAKTKYVDIPKSRFRRLYMGIYLIIKYLTKKPLCLIGSLSIAKYGLDAINLKMLYRAIHYMNSNSYDIIHCQFGFLGPTVVKLKELGLFKGKIVTSFRGYDISGFVKNNGIRTYKDLFVKGDLFLPVSDDFKKRLIQYGCDEKKIIVHRDGIDLSKFKYQPRVPTDSGVFRLISIGRLVEKKGFEFSIKAVAGAVKKNKKIFYRIIGDGPLRDYLNHLITQLGMQQYIKLDGSMKHTEVINCLNESHILIAPSVIASDGDEEGIPTVLKEAMATGIPVISSDHSGVAELVSNGISGFLAPEKDVKSLEAKILYLSSCPKVCLKMAIAGREHIENYYDINKLNDELCNIYFNLLKI